MLFILLSSSLPHLDRCLSATTVSSTLSGEEQIRKCVCSFLKPRILTLPNIPCCIPNLWGSLPVYESIVCKWWMMDFKEALVGFPLLFLLSVPPHHLRFHVTVFHIFKVLSCGCRPFRWGLWVTDQAYAKALMNGTEQEDMCCNTGTDSSWMWQWYLTA